MNQEHGTLRLVGIGPGSPACLTREAWQALSEATTIAGYPMYISLLPDELRAHRRQITSGMRHEEERCQKAIDAARAGERVCLVSSGDTGIYALAGLTLELLERDGLTETLDWSILPGVPALCAAAALLGAPLGHDFACVSLSDLLTPWPCIERRLTAALSADFVLVLYNPKSRGRPGYLATALSLAEKYRSPDCPVGMVRQAYRQDQSVLIRPLKDFDPGPVDMLSIVIIGNSMSRSGKDYMLTPRGYHIRTD